MYTNRVSEVMYPLVQEFADSIAAGTANSAWVLMRDYHRAWLVVNVGDMGAGATLNVTIRQAQDSGGSNAKVITGKTITQLTQAGGDSDSLVCIELQTEELDVDGGYEYIGVQTVVAVAAVELGWVLYGTSPRYAPVPVTNWQEIIG